MSEASTPQRTGPLAGIRVVEFGGLGPGPYCGMLLSDLGAEVLLIDRDGGNGWPNPITDRAKARLILDIRSEEGRETALTALDRADVLIEGFRPGVMERLGLGPEPVLARNPRLIYGRMTGWGQEGPLARAAGHDINYIALTGALAGIGVPGGTSIPPLNLVGDFGGGALFLAFGIVAALHERATSGQGQVVDAAIIDGVNSMMSFFAGLVPSKRLTMDRQRNLLAGSAPFYRCYRCADGREIAVGPLEPHFLKILVERIGAPEDLAARMSSPANWEETAGQLAEIFATKTRAEWSGILEGTDACFAPVLELDEVPDHPQMQARASHTTIAGIRHPVPAPRFSRTPGSIGKDVEGVARLRAWLSETRHE